MPKLPRLSGAEIIKILQKMGFYQARQRGSHVVMKKITPEGAVGCVASPCTEKLQPARFTASSNKLT
jgi:predicted RNA binding protein YcfA (HicA-like mRNA interferase family)